MPGNLVLHFYFYSYDISTLSGLSNNQVFPQLFLCNSFPCPFLHFFCVAFYYKYVCVIILINDCSFPCYLTHIGPFSYIAKYSRATSRVSLLSDEESNISRTISVLVFMVLMYLENPSAPGIGLTEFHALVGALANGSS
jgi:hypothetical protein